MGSYTSVLTDLRFWSLVIDGLTLAVLFVTLLKIREYVTDTAQIAKASNEQAEAAQRPYLVTVEVYRTTYDVIAEAPHAMRLPPGDVRLHNIGPGVAVNVLIVFDEMTPTGWEPGLGIRAGYLRPGDPYQTPRTAESMNGVHRVTATYESMSGRRYVTQVTWEERVVKERLVRPMQPGEGDPVHRPNPWELTIRELGPESESEDVGR